MKRCFVCKKERETSMFYIDKSRKDWMQPKCKECESILRKRRRRTHEWAITAMFRWMVDRCNERWREPLRLTREEVKAWVEEYEWYLYIYWIREESWYDRSFAPSINRIDPYWIYELWNMEILSRRDHMKKDAWVKTRVSIDCICMKTLKLVESFESILDVNRKYWYSRSWISECIHWRRRSVWWFFRVKSGEPLSKDLYKWKYYTKTALWGIHMYKTKIELAAKVWVTERVLTNRISKWILEINWHSIFSADDFHHKGKWYVVISAKKNLWLKEKSRVKWSKRNKRTRWK